LSEESYEVLKSLIIYPNPATDELFFSFKNALNETADLYIYDTRGMKIMETQISHKGVQSIEIKSLKSGIYLYHLKSGSGETRGKFIVE
jgi:hypothetical protein